MKWRKLNHICIAIDTHCVCKAGSKYVAYDRLKTGGYEQFSDYDNAEDAKRRCESEAKINKGKLKK